ncbi:putative ATPase ASNA1 -like protein, partial [Capsicum annuum]
FLNLKCIGWFNFYSGLSIRMETRIDFVQSLESDMSVNILTSLNDPVDVVRAGSVSNHWHHFVITNGLSKQLCLRRFPQLSRIVQIIEPAWITTEANRVGSHNSSWDILKRDHNVYASLLHAITTLNTCRSECIGYAVSASSTDRFPGESVVNTLTTRDRYLGRPSYWSSKGHADPDASETLIYKLKADLCVISEISVQPFEAFFQPGKPIYSAKSVRFRFGHPKNSLDGNDILQVPLQQPADDKFIWTYTSEVYPMAQENRLQQFKLPEPVLCVGGYLQIELLGRVQRQHTDDLFYICVSHVKVTGGPLCPAFDIEILEPLGKFALKYNPEVLRWMLQSFSEDSNVSPMSSEEEMVQHVGVMGFLLQDNHVGVAPVVWDDDDEEMDDPGLF